MDDDAPPPYAYYFEHPSLCVLDVLMVLCILAAVVMPTGIPFLIGSFLIGGLFWSMRYHG